MATHQTSREANRSITPRKNTLRMTVLNYLYDCKQYGATDEEMQEGLGMNPSTQRPRRGELVELRAVEDSGRRRSTRSNRKAIVWIVPKKHKETLFD